MGMIDMGTSKAIAKHITLMEAGVADCLINRQKIQVFIKNCNKSIANVEAKAKYAIPSAPREEKEKIKEQCENEIKVNKEQIDEHVRDRDRSFDMMVTMNEIINNLKAEYFPGIIGKVLFFILK